MQPEHWLAALLVLAALLGQPRQAYESGLAADLTRMQGVSGA